MYIKLFLPAHIMLVVMISVQKEKTRYIPISCNVRSNFLNRHKTSRDKINDTTIETCHNTKNRFFVIQSIQVVIRK